MYITLQINFWKPDRVSAAMEQPPAGLVKPEPYRASCPIITKTPIYFPKINPVVMYMYTLSPYTITKYRLKHPDSWVYSNESLCTTMLCPSKQAWAYTTRLYTMEQNLCVYEHAMFIHIKYTDLLLFGGQIRVLQLYVNPKA